MSKRILSLILVLVMLVGCLAGCFKKPTTQGNLPVEGDDDKVCEHTYSNTCDATCDKCGETRAITHTYSYGCAPKCNVCGAANDAPEHTYSHACDTTCNNCTVVREVPAHPDADDDGICDVCEENYRCEHETDSVCDDVCNLCGSKLEAPHSYSAVCDNTCDLCGNTRVAADHDDTANGGFIDGVCDVCSTKFVETLYAPKKGTYNTTTSVMPSNWNELTYSDGNDTQILSYIGSSFFSYDYKYLHDKKFNADGSINKAGIVDGAFSVYYDAATKLEDVTSTVDAKWGYTADQKAEGGYAWKITLRNDLKWDDGTPIKAADFVYSMLAQLDPAFMNFRANTYYETLMIKNSYGYFFQNQEGVYNGVGAMGYASNQEAIDAGETLMFDVYEAWGMQGYVNEAGEACPQWLPLFSEEVYYLYEDGEVVDAVSAKDVYDYYVDVAGYGPYFEVGQALAYCISIYVENEVRYVAAEDVGIYSIDSENAIVVCLDKAYSFLNDDGSLSVWSAYYMSSLPLVKKDLYESCKQAPKEGSTLWTTNYNSSLATTASWGPYMLTAFEAGSNYTLTKNANWHGYAMATNQNQYNITTIECRKLDNAETQWMGFLSGEFDDSSLQTFNVDEYLDSKYVSYSEGSTGTYGMQLFSDLNTLKNSGNNNGILAIQQFRHAFNLALNRSDIIAKIWPGTCTPCFGLVNVAYYYDIEGATSLADGGKYRNSVQAKEGVLRAYGYVQDAEGYWSVGEDLTDLTLDEAYETLTGYNMDLAKQELQAAIDILLADPAFYGYDATKNITLVYGSSSDTDKQRFRAQYLQDVLDELTAGTVLADKIDVIFDASAGNQWAEAFRSGATQIGFGYGFQGNAFNPFDIIGAFVNPDDDLNYHQYWDTSAINLTLTLPVVAEMDYEGEGQTITMNVQNWYYCLNGRGALENQPETYNWGEGFAPSVARLTILSALEEVALKECRSIMLIADSGGSFLGAQFANFSDSYNTFMSFGGLQYMEVVYTDVEWDEFVAANNGDLSSEYKKSE